MEIFNRKLWGKLLFWLGVLVLVVLVHNSIRPYFPRKNPSQFLKNIPMFFKKLFPSRPPTSKKVPPPRKALPPPPKISYQEFHSNPKIMLTKHVHPMRGEYDLWVWGVKPERKTGNAVKVKMAHAGVGERGGFWIVAYADTNGDGKPDKEIAKSEFLASDRRVAWSSFTFTTQEKRIFVGSTWPKGSNNLVFRWDGPWPLKDSPFEDRFYHVVSPNKSSTAGPAYTNMKISFSD